LGLHLFLPVCGEREETNTSKRSWGKPHEGNARFARDHQLTHLFSHSQIKETAPTRRQSPAEARPAEPRIAHAQSAHVRTECGFTRWRRKSGSRKGGRPGQEWADQGHEGQEAEDDQGGQLLEGDGLEREEGVSGARSGFVLIILSTPRVSRRTSRLCMITINGMEDGRRVRPADVFQTHIRKSETCIHVHHTEHQKQEVY
jgi:hypothetical protein